MSQFAVSDGQPGNWEEPDFFMRRLEIVRFQANGWQEPYESRGSRTDLGSGRQGCNPAGESPAMPIARFRHAAIPQFMWVTTCPLRGVNGPAALRIVIHSGGSNLGA
jgi:hypothetical protein